jgi:hypothetical protein
VSANNSKFEGLGLVEQIFGSCEEESAQSGVTAWLAALFPIVSKVAPTVAFDEDAPAAEQAESLQVLLEVILNLEMCEPSRPSRCRCCWR